MAKMALFSVINWPCFQLTKTQDLDLPIFLANPELLERLEHFAQEMLDRLSPPESWSGRVTHLIGQALLRGDKPTLDAVAYELVISRRHLQNKLREEGTTYRVLLDELRKETSLKYLTRPEVPLFDIAFLLGFSEQSAFNHAFKRWTGTSPQQYRRLALSALPLG
jgi:AraC-like DNA-binding protein